MSNVRSKRISKQNLQIILIETGFTIFLMLLVSACSAISDETNQFSTAAEQETVTGSTEQIEVDQSVGLTTPAPTPLTTRDITPVPGQIQPDPVQNLEISDLPDPEGFEWRQIAGGLLKPVSFVHLTDQTGRFLVVEQPGLVRVMENGVILPEPFLDIQDRVSRDGSEQGLLDLELDPEFAENGIFYINYTNQAGNTRVSRFHTTDTHKYEADPNSEEIILEIPQPYGNHNGGDIDFGPDGFLYIATGDGGSAGDPLGNAQSLDNLLGKILRIDVRGELFYSIPEDNPFKTGGVREEIWAYGLRNPWRFSFDSLTGDIYIADVGQNQWEEINYLEEGEPAGVNFGWNYFEGSHEYSGTQPSGIELEPPVSEYNHGSGCSVTGGEAYRGTQLPEFYGVYLYGDYCSGNVWGLLKDNAGTWQSKLLFENVGNISSFGFDVSGELYLVDHNGIILKLVRKVN